MPSNGSTEQNVQDSINGTGGIPLIEMSMEVSGMTQTAVDKTLSITDMAADAKATGDAIRDVADDLTNLATDVSDIQQWTGEDIRVNTESSKTVAEAIASVTGDTYPVGSIFMTTSDATPPFDGTWVEIAITATWAQLKTGKRDYAELASGDTGGTVHFWLRTE